MLVPSTRGTVYALFDLILAVLEGYCANKGSQEGESKKPHRQDTLATIKEGCHLLVVIYEDVKVPPGSGPRAA